MSLKGETCKGGKLPKERVIILLCVIILGEFEIPLSFSEKEYFSIYEQWSITSSDGIIEY